jgi:hypothetical protein
MSLFENIWKQPKTETKSEPPTVQEEVKRVLAQPQLTVQRQSEMTIGSLADFEPQVVMRDIPVHKKIVKSRKREYNQHSPLVIALKNLSISNVTGEVVVGDCFDIPHQVIRQVSGDTSFVYQLADEAGVKVHVKKTPNGDYRVWRLPKKDTPDDNRVTFVSH